VPLEGCFPLAPSFDHAGPMARSTRGCAAMLEALAPGFRRSEAELDDLRIGVAWVDTCEPLVRARVASAAGRFSHRRPLDFPFPPEETGELFMREVAESHQGLYPEHAEAYGENVRTKLERCVRVTDRQAEAGRRAREAYRRQAEEALGELDLLLTPTLAFVAPPVEADELTERRAMIRFTFPFNALGWPVLALPCGPAEGGLPASLELVGRPGADALVLAAGEALEAALAL
jgi:Asp-tRNA(Asn)/Glu-tRNA(Gln) amidotransferase A subunit family amidase